MEFSGEWKCADDRLDHKADGCHAIQCTVLCAHVQLFGNVIITFILFCVSLPFPQCKVANVRFAYENSSIAVPGSVVGRHRETIWRRVQEPHRIEGTMRHPFIIALSLSCSRSAAARNVTYACHRHQKLWRPPLRQQRDLCRSIRCFSSRAPPTQQGLLSL